MADEPQVLRGINWRETFPFTHVFRAFRIAIHPSKLVLALLTVLSLYLGGRILDALWLRDFQAIPGEVTMYEQAPSSEAFLAARQTVRRNAEETYAGLQRQAARAKGIEPAVVTPSDIRYWVARTERVRMIGAATDRYEQAAKGTDATAIRNAAAALEQTRRQANDWAQHNLQVVDTVNGQGLFLAFFNYQTLQLQKVVDAVLDWNWLGGLPGNQSEIDGVFASAFKFFTVAPAWSLRYHWFYFLLYGALFLAVWSLFGGAISRIAAVHVADEGRKLSMRQGVGFAVSKFLSFLSAPLIPLIIVAGIGLAVAIIGGVAFLLYLDVLVGAFYFLALAAGFVMTLVLLGFAGGFALMYPTIAVEGSDSFDAISRSFSYVYAKPWRMLFYSAVAVAYGAVTYLFVRLFIWLVLLLTHVSVGLLVFTRQDAAGSNLWALLQPLPEFRHLPFSINFASLNAYESVTAFLLSAWVYLAIAMLGAFAISFYFSASTIIYYLIRRDADATEMDDVYLEQPEEELVEAPAPAVPAEEGTSEMEAAPATAMAAPATAAVTTEATAEPNGADAADQGGAEVYPSPASSAAPEASEEDKETPPSNPPNA